MAIDDLIFLLIFFPVSLTVYYLSSNKAKEFVLLLLSLLFYAIGSIKCICLFMAMMVITVVIGRTMAVNNRKNIRILLLVLGSAINIGVLFWYKFFDFINSNFLNSAYRKIVSKELILPLGLSFFTFKSISYLCDIYNRKVDLDPNPIHDAFYLSFFAQIQAGPITRYNEMKCNAEKSYIKDDISYGIYRFMIGFCKKILISGSLSNITNEIFNAPFDNFSTGYAWLGSICFSLQLFFDFAGYSDMAIGITRMFGYKCKENFNYPYVTESVSKFWRRWHISLSEWFRDYVYIPLGGSKSENKMRIFFNLFIVWILTGIWHGSNWNFIVWGLGYFIVISLERLTGIPNRLCSKSWKIIYRVFVLLFINFQWVIFKSPDLLYCMRYIKRMFLCEYNSMADTRLLFLLKDYGFFIVIALVLSTPVVPMLENKFNVSVVKFSIFEMVKYIVLIFAFVWSISFVVAGQNNPFLYANF